MKISKSLKRKRVSNSLGGQEDLAMESKVAEQTSRGEQANQQASASFHWPSGAKKAKDELANVRLCSMWHVCKLKLC